MVWYSHLLKNFPQFVVIHTVKGFDILNKAKVDVFLELSCFFDNPKDVGNFWQRNQRSDRDNGIRTNNRKILPDSLP